MLEILITTFALMNVSMAMELPACQDRPTTGVGQPSNLTWERLEALLTSEKAPASIDELMAMTSDHLDYWTAVYESRSLQAEYTTPERPRILAFGSDAKLIMTFASCDHQSLEVMDYNEKTKKFTFREVTFDSGKPVISEPNSMKCLGCHGMDPRPIWNTYNFWPGTYGSLSRGGFDVIKKGSSEHKFYESFRREIESKDICGRYKSLRWSDGEVGESTSDDLKNLDLMPAALSRCGNSPNDFMTAFLVRMNMEKNLDDIVSNKSFQKYKKALKAVNETSYSDTEWLQKFFAKEDIENGPSLEEIRAGIENKQKTSFVRSAALTLRTNNLTCEKYKKPTWPDGDDELYCPKPFAMDKDFRNKAARLQFILRRMGLDLGRMTISRDFAFSFTDFLTSDRMLDFSELEKY